MQGTSEHKSSGIIYLDNAATSWPKPESVYTTMDDFLRSKGGNPGRGSHSMAADAGEVVEETRKLAARVFNAPASSGIIFTFNCTDSLNMGLKGLLRPGDHVITDSVGHNSVVRPLARLERYGVTVTRIKSTANGYVFPADIEAGINSRTKLIIITHGSNVNGVVQPITEFGRLAQKHNIWLMVDAAQTAGKIPIDVQESGIDLLACSGHKGLFGPPGTGILYVSERVELDPLREGGTGSYSEQEEQPEVCPDKFESGTLNSVGISGLGAGIKFIFNEGLAKIQKHEKYLMDRLISGLSQIPGITLYGASDSSYHVPVISCNIEGYEPGEAGIILDQAFNIKVRTGLHCAPAAHKTLGTYPKGTVRISPGYFNTGDDIDIAIDAFGRIAGGKHVR